VKPVAGDDETRHREGVFSRLFYRSAEGEEGRGSTRHYSEEEVGLGASGDFSVERAVEIIENLPRDVSRRSAREIVTRTLEAAGVDIREFLRSSRGREEALRSEIEQGEERIEELQRTADEIIRSLRKEIDATREKCEEDVRAEEERIERIRASLLDLNRVREFFGLEEEDSTRVLSDPNRTEVISEDEEGERS
jgi:hypothetical protein